MADDMKRRREVAAAAFAARRDELKMTQEDVAYRAGVVVKTVYNFETGRWPNGRTRARLERAVGWESGAIERLTAEPEPELPPKLLELASQLSADEKEALVRTVTRWIREQRDEGPSQKAANG